MRIGFGLTSSFCTLEQVIQQMEILAKNGHEIIPIANSSVTEIDTKFGKGKMWQERIEALTNREIIESIKDAEPLGPTLPLDVMVIAPATGNTVSKLANAITDSPVLMATKATLRNQNPVVIAISTNDCLGLNGVNIMRLLATKNIYFVPFGQDNPITKPNSCIAHFDMLLDTILDAKDGKQIQPILKEHK